MYFAENLEKNIISYGLLESKGCGISYRGEYRVVAALNEGPAVLDLGIHNNVLVVRAQKCELGTTGRDVLMSALVQHDEDVGQDVQKGSLMHFHKRLAHFNYDTIIRMGKDPASGIQQNDELRANCLDCAQGKTNQQPAVSKGHWTKRTDRRDWRSYLIRLEGTDGPTEQVGQPLHGEFYR